MCIANKPYHVHTDVWTNLYHQPCVSAKPTCLCLAIIILTQSPSIMITSILLHIRSARLLPLNWTCIHDASYKIRAIQRLSKWYVYPPSFHKGAPPPVLIPHSCYLVATSHKPPSGNPGYRPDIGDIVRM